VVLPIEEATTLTINETDWYPKNARQALFNSPEDAEHPPSTLAEMKYIELNLQIAPTINFSDNLWDFSGCVKVNYMTPVSIDSIFLILEVRACVSWLSDMSYGLYSRIETVTVRYKMDFSQLRSLLSF
jgi:hypothetical protein